MKLATQKRIACNLKILRINNNLSQTQMADRVGLTRSLYTQYELGNRVPDAEALYEIAVSFGINMNLFFEAEPDKFMSQIIFSEVCEDGDSLLLINFHKLTPFSKGRLMEKAEFLLEWDRIRAEKKNSLKDQLKHY